MDRNGTKRKKHAQTVRKRRGKCEPRLASALFRGKTAEHLFCLFSKLVIWWRQYFVLIYFTLAVTSNIEACLNKDSQLSFCCGPNCTHDFSSTPSVASLWKHLNLRQVSQQQMLWLYTNHLLHFCIQESAKKLNGEVCQVSPGIAFV